MLDCVKPTNVPTIAAFRLATNDVNLVYIDSTLNASGKPRTPSEPEIVKVEQRGRNTREAKLEILFMDGQMTAGRRSRGPVA